MAIGDPNAYLRGEGGTHLGDHSVSPVAQGGNLAPMQAGVPATFNEAFAQARKLAGGSGGRFMYDRGDDRGLREFHTGIANEPVLDAIWETPMTFGDPDVANPIDANNQAAVLDGNANTVTQKETTVSSEKPAARAAHTRDKQGRGSSWDLNLTKLLGLDTPTSETSGTVTMDMPPPEGAVTVTEQSVSAAPEVIPEITSPDDAMLSPVASPITEPQPVAEQDVAPAGDDLPPPTGSLDQELSPQTILAVGQGSTPMEGELGGLFDLFEEEEYNSQVKIIEMMETEGNSLVAAILRRMLSADLGSRYVPEQVAEPTMAQGLNRAMRGG